MQTLTRLLAQLWQALFPAPWPRQRLTLEPHKYRRGDSRRVLADFAKINASLPLCLRVGPLAKAHTSRSTLGEDSDDIAFCAWMYYLN